MEVQIETTRGNLSLPPDPRGLVVFAHGSGSSRFSPRNQYIADVLKKNSFGTLLADLLTREEEVVDICTGEYRFNVKLLTERLLLIAEWVGNNPNLKGLKLGFLGASTGAAAALATAAQRTRDVFAIVSRGGRPDLAYDSLKDVAAPTLLIVGERDPLIGDLNKEALECLNKQSELHTVRKATHLFEERGAIEEVATRSAKWFKEFIQPVS